MYKVIRREFSVLAILLCKRLAKICLRENPFHFDRTFSAPSTLVRGQGARQMRVIPLFILPDTSRGPSHTASPSTVDRATTMPPAPSRGR